MGLHEEAANEMRRFLAVADSEAYRELLKDMAEELEELP
jgi:hypothetical protein